MTSEGNGGLYNGIWALYSIFRAYVPESVFFSDHYLFTRERLSAEGKIKHALDTRPERLKPITLREWSRDAGWLNDKLPSVATVAPQTRADRSN